MSSVNVEVNNKFSVRLALKARRLREMLKPVLRLIISRKSSRCVDCSAAATKASWADECELQNDANEALEARLKEDIAHAVVPGGPSAMMTVLNNGQWTLVRVNHGQIVRVPVAFLAARDGGFLWAPLADGDVCLGGGFDGHVLTSGQAAEKQVPTATRQFLL